VTPVDIPKLTREVDQKVLVTALASASAGELGPAADFILDNMSKRMADALREEIQEIGAIKPRDGEDAMTQVVIAIRQLEAAGEITLKTSDDEDTED